MCGEASRARITGRGLSKWVSTEFFTSWKVASWWWPQAQRVFLPGGGGAAWPRRNGKSSGIQRTPGAPAWRSAAPCPWLYVEGGGALSSPMTYPKNLTFGVPRIQFSLFTHRPVGHLLRESDFCNLAKDLQRVAYFAHLMLCLSRSSLGS